MFGSNNFYIFFAYISSFSTLFPFTIAFICRNYLQREHKTLWLLISCSILTEIVSYILIYVFKTGNVSLFNFYIILETILISLYYFLSINNKTFKICISIFNLWFISYAIIELTAIHGKNLNNVLLTTQSLMVMASSIVTFNSLIKDQKHNNILSAPIFWINCAFLFYFAGNMVLHLFSNYLQEHALYTFYELWGLWHSLLNILFYSLISIGFWKTKT